MQHELLNDKLYHNLIEIRKHPKMWLSNKTLSALNDYLTGFFACSDVPMWYDYFKRYVCDNCPNSTFGGNIITNIFNNGYSEEEEGFDFFFELLSKFSISFETDQEVSQSAHKAYAVKLSFSAVSHMASLNVLSQAIALFDADEAQDLAVFGEWSKGKETLTIVLGNKNNITSDLLLNMDVESLPLVETTFDSSMLTKVLLD